MLLNRGENGFGTPGSLVDELTQILVNPTFSDTSGWTVDSGTELSGGKLVFDGIEEFPYTYQDLPAEFQNINGTIPLRITVVVDSISQGFIWTSYNSAQNITTPGTHVYYTSITSTQFEAGGEEFCDAVIDSIKAEVLSDNELGPELITNGGFANATGWTLYGSHSIAGGKLLIDGAGVATNDAATMNEELKLYKLMFTISDYVNGTLAGAIDSGGGSAGTLTGDYTADGLAATNFSSGVGLTGSFAFRASNTPGTASMSVDNVSLKKYT